MSWFWAYAKTHGHFQLLLGGERKMRKASARSMISWVGAIGVELWSAKLRA